MFINRYEVNSPQSFSETGSILEPVFEISVDDCGCDCLIVKKHHNVDDEIQSYRDDVDMNRILQNLGIKEIHFEDSIAPVVDSGVDFSKLPKTLGDWFNFSKTIDNIYKTLPATAKAEIGSRYDLYNYLYSYSKNIKAIQKKAKRIENDISVNNDELNSEV